MTAMIPGKRIGTFVIFHDEEGNRHAVKLSAVLAMSDADGDQCATIVHLTGNRKVMVLTPLDKMLNLLL